MTSAFTGPNWLNDAILGFYFSFLQKDKYASLRRSVSFVDASVSFLVANVAEGDVAGILEPLGLQRQIVLFSVSNNEDVEVPEGGSHWSLLVFRKGERGGMDTFEHYDSAGAVNERAASGLVAAVAPYLATPGGTSLRARQRLRPDRIMVTTVDCTCWPWRTRCAAPTSSVSLGTLTRSRH